MAKKKFNPSRVVKKNLPTIGSWLTNAGKSVGVAAMDVITETLPSTANVATSAAEFVQNFKNDLLDMKTQQSRVSDAMDLAYWKNLVQTAKNNTLEDLKSGKLYHSMDETYDEQFGDDFDLDFGDDFDMGDDDDYDASFDSEDGTTSITTRHTSADGDTDIDQVNVQVDVGNNSKLVQSVEGQTRAAVDIHRESMEFSKESTNVLMTTLSKTNEALSGLLGSIDSNVASMTTMVTTISQSSSVQLKYYEDSMGVFNNILGALTEMKGGSAGGAVQEQREYQDVLDMFNQGTLDMSEYMNLVKKQFGAAVDRNVILMNFKNILSDKDTLTAAFAHPLNFLVEKVVKTIIPETVREAGAAFDATLGEALIAGLHQVRGLADSDNPILQFLGETFGITNKLKTDVDRTNYKRGKVDWDGQSHKTLNEVIPYYLRKITAALTGEREVGFDYNRGIFKSVKAMRDEYEEDDNRRLTAGFSSVKSDFKDFIRSGGYVFSNTKGEEAVSEAMNRFLRTLVTSNAAIRKRKNENTGEVSFLQDIADIVSSGDTDNDYAKLISAFFDTRENSSVMETFGKNILESRAAFSKYKQREESGEILTNNMYSKQTGTTVDDFLDKKTGRALYNTKSPLLDKDKYGNTPTYYLRNILSLLAKGIKTFPNIPADVTDIGRGITDAIRDSITVVKDVDDKEKKKKEEKKNKKKKQGSTPTTTSTPITGTVPIYNPGADILAKLADQESKASADETNDRVAVDGREKDKEQMEEQLKLGKILIDKSGMSDSSYAQHIANASQYEQKRREDERDKEDEDSFFTKITGLNSDKPITKIVNKFSEYLKTPSKVLVDLFGRADDFLFKLVFGGDLGVKNSIFAKALDFVKKQFTTFSTWLNDKILEPLHEKFFGDNGLFTNLKQTALGQRISDFFGNARTTLFGEKDADGEYTGGFFSDYANDLGDNLKSIMDEIVGDAKAVGTTVANTAADLFLGKDADGKSLKEKGKSIWDKLVDTIDSYMGSITNASGDRDGSQFTATVKTIGSEVKGSKLAADATVGGAISLLFTGSPVPGFLLGGGFSTAKQSETAKNILKGVGIDPDKISIDGFKDFMFGAKDADGNRVGGVLSPIADKIKQGTDTAIIEITRWVETNVVNTMAIAVEPIMEEGKRVANRIKVTITDAVTGIKDVVMDHIVKPVGDSVKETFEPVTTAAKKAASFTIHAAGSAAALPLKAIEGLAYKLDRKHLKEDKREYMDQTLGNALTFNKKKRKKMGLNENVTAGERIAAALKFISGNGRPEERTYTINGKKINPKQLKRLRDEESSAWADYALKTPKKERMSRDEFDEKNGLYNWKKEGRDRAKARKDSKTKVKGPGSEPIKNMNVESAKMSVDAKVVEIKGDLSKVYDKIVKPTEARDNAPSKDKIISRAESYIDRLAKQGKVVSSNDAIAHASEFEAKKGQIVDTIRNSKFGNREKNQKNQDLFKKQMENEKAKVLAAGGTWTEELAREFTKKYRKLLNKDVKDPRSDSYVTTSKWYDKHGADILGDTKRGKQYKKREYEAREKERERLKKENYKKIESFIAKEEVRAQRKGVQFDRDTAAKKAMRKYVDDPLEKFVYKEDIAGKKSKGGVIKKLGAYILSKGERVIPSGNEDDAQKEQEYYNRLQARSEKNKNSKIAAAITALGVDADERYVESEDVSKEDIAGKKSKGGVIKKLGAYILSKGEKILHRDKSKDKDDDAQKEQEYYNRLQTRSEKNKNSKIAAAITALGVDADERYVDPSSISKEDIKGKRSKGGFIKEAGAYILSKGEKILHGDKSKDKDDDGLVGKLKSVFSKDEKTSKRKETEDKELKQTQAKGSFETKEKLRKEQAEKEEQRTWRQTMLDAVTTFKENATAHYDSWNGIFGKKGKIALAILAMSPVIAKIAGYIVDLLNGKGILDDIKDHVASMFASVGGIEGAIKRIKDLGNDFKELLFGKDSFLTRLENFIFPKDDKGENQYTGRSETLLNAGVNLGSKAVGKRFFKLSNKIDDIAAAAEEYAATGKGKKRWINYFDDAVDNVLNAPSNIKKGLFGTTTKTGRTVSVDKLQHVKDTGRWDDYIDAAMRRYDNVKFNRKGELVLTNSVNDGTGAISALKDFFSNTKMGQKVSKKSAQKNAAKRAKYADKLKDTRDVMTKVTDFLSDMKQQPSQIKSNIKSEASKIGDGVTDALTGLKDRISNFADNKIFGQKNKLNVFFKDEFKNADDYLRQMEKIKGMDNLVNLKEIDGGFEYVFKKDRLGERARKKVKPIASKASEFFKDIGKSAASVVKKIGNSLQGIADNTIKGIQSLASKAWKGVSGGLKKLAGGVGTIVAGIGSVIKQGAARLANGVSSVVKWAGEHLSDITESARQTIGKLAKGLKGKVDIVVDGAKNVAGRVAEGAKSVGTKAKGVVKHVGTKAKEFGDDVAKRAASVATKVKNSKVVTGAVDAAKKVGFGAKRTGYKIANSGVGKAVTNIVTEKSTAAKGAVVSLAEKSGKVTGKVTTTVKDIMTGGESGKKAMGFLKSAFDSIKGLVNKLIKKFSNGKGSKTFLGKLDDLFKTAIKFVTNGKNLSNFMSKLAKGAGIAASGIGIISGLAGGTKANTANLFYVDESEVDLKMQAISLLWSELQGIPCGAGTVFVVIDIVNEILTEVAGIDFIREAATLIYGILSDDEDTQKLTDAQSKFEQQYNTDMDALYDAYAKEQTAKGEEVLSRDAWQAENGKSLAEYNDEKHRTAGAKIFDAAKKGITTVKNSKFAQTMVKGYSQMRQAHMGDVFSKNYWAVDTMNEDGTQKDQNEILKEKMQKALMAPLHFVSGAVNGVIETVTGTVDIIKTTAKNFGQNTKDAFASITGGTTVFKPEYWEQPNSDDSTDAGNLSKIAFILNRIVMFIPGLIFGIGKSIGKGIGNIVDKVKKGATLIKDTTDFSKITSMADVFKGEYWKAPEDPQNPMNAMQRAVFYAGRLITFIPSAVIGLGKDMGKMFAPIIDPIKKLAGPLIDKVKGALTKDNDQEPEEDSLGGMNRMLYYTAKILGVVPKAFIGIGKVVGKVVTPIFKGVKTIFGSTFTGVEDLMMDPSRVFTQEFWKYDAADTGDAPKELGAMGMALHIGGKLLAFPVAGVLSIFKRVGSVVGPLISGIVKVVPGVLSNTMNRFKNLWKKGFVSVEGGKIQTGLSGWFDIPNKEEGPLGAVQTVLSVLTNIPLFIPLAITGVIGTAKNAIQDVIKAFKVVGEGVSDVKLSDEEISKTSPADFFSDIKMKNGSEDSTGLAGFLHKTGRIMYAPVFLWKKYISPITDSIGKFFSGLGNSIKDAWDGFGKNWDDFKGGLTGWIDDIKEWFGFGGNGDGELIDKTNEITVDRTEPVSSTSIYENGSKRRATNGNGIGEKLRNKLKKDKVLGGNGESVLETATKQSGGIYAETVEPVKSTRIHDNGSKRRATNGNGIGEKLRNKLKKDKVLGGNGEAPDTENGFPYYSQNDPKIKDKPYRMSGGRPTDVIETMGNRGCGPTAMAMVASKIEGGNGNPYSPENMAKIAEQGNYSNEFGTMPNYFTNVGTQLGMNVTPALATAGNIDTMLGNGQPVIVQGASNNPNSPFTSSGHYVVAVGKDENGNVLVNDPRGKSHSGKYTMDQLTDGSARAWGFSGSGIGKKFVNTVKGGFGKLKKLLKIKGGNGSSWMDVVRAVKAAIAAQKPNYSQTNYIHINVNGRDIKVRTDCSGFVSACVDVYGDARGYVTDSRGFTNRGNGTLLKLGFTPLGWSSWNDLQEGDIIAKDGHVEIFSRNDGTRHLVYNAGWHDSINNPGETGSSKPSYTTVWRAPGKSVDVSLSSGSTGTTTASSDTTTSTGGSKYMAAMTALSTEMMKPIQEYLYGKSETTDSTATSSGDYSNANISGSDNAEKVWNFFTSLGYSKAATAGILGNMHAESGVDPARIQGGNKGPAAGIVQWENWSKKTDRWKAMSDYAASKGKNWTDLQSQLEYVDKELRSLDSAYWTSSKNMSKAGTTGTSFDKWVQSTDVNTATRQFEGAFERAGKPHMDRRLSAAQSYYNLYAGGNGESVVGGNGDMSIPYIDKGVNELPRYHKTEVEPEKPVRSATVGGNGDMSIPYVDKGVNELPRYHKTEFEPEKPVRYTTTGGDGENSSYKNMKQSLSRTEKLSQENAAYDDSNVVNALVDLQQNMIASLQDLLVEMRGTNEGVNKFNEKELVVKNNTPIVYTQNQTNIQGGNGSGQQQKQRPPKQTQNTTFIDENNYKMARNIASGGFSFA